MVFVFVWFTSLGMIISRSIRVDTKGIISFLFMAEQDATPQLVCWHQLCSGLSLQRLSVPQSPGRMAGPLTASSSHSVCWSSGGDHISQQVGLVGRDAEQPSSEPVGALGALALSPR